ncbi:MAG: translocation/assembly module TamB domain-containing protein, partial [Bdellovibrionota bacterium]
AEGEVTADQEKITYTTELSMPDSKGRSSGTISYETGFDIGFEADRLSMKDVTSLANLKIEGAARVKGSTSGTSRTGSVSLFLDGTDMWFENYWLGNPKGTIAYKDGSLYFTGLQGHYTVSRYGGDVTLNLREKKIAVTGRIPFFDARDLLKIFSRRVKLPFPVNGTGQATVKLSGPLDFPHLSYDLKSSLFRGSVAGETFDQAHFDIKSVGGEVKTERVQLAKGAAMITLTGVAHPTGQIETSVRGRGIRLEDTNTIATTGLALSGQVDFDMGMTGHVLAPDTDMKGTLTKTSIGDQSVADSNFRLKFGKKAIEGSGVFMGDVVQGDLVFPFDADAPFHLRLKTQDWNFAPLFAAIAGPNSRKDYQGRLSADVDFSSATGGFWNATGDAKISNFSLSRGSLALKSTGPIEINMKNGQLHTKDLNLTGDGIFLKVTDSPDAVAKLDSQITGKVDLGLLALLTPFFEDLRGLVSFSVNLRGGDRPAEILGSAYLEKGYLKFFAFPHPFEDIRADLLFNQKKILLNTIKAEFGSGQIAGTGGLEFKGRHDIPVNLAGTFEKITLNVPDKMRTTGSGNFTFTGNWFPFLLKGNYIISEGVMTKEFGGEQGGTDNVRRDFYLPDVLVEQDFAPLLLDLNVDFTKGIAVKNELVEGRAMGQLSVKGQPTKPVLLGSITTDKETKVNFRDTIFEVTNSNVTFDGSDVIDPKLYMTAVSRVGTYDITLLLQGSGTAPQIQLSSVPPLPEKDIVSLLAFGATDQDLNQKISSNAQASQTGLQVGTGVIKNNVVTNTIRQTTGFDVQFSAGFDDSNNSTTKIVASRRFGQKVGVNFSRSLGKAPETEGKVQYRLTDKFSVIGSAQTKDYTETAESVTTTEKTSTKLGLDFEYRFQFK